MDCIRLGGSFYGPYRLLGIQNLYENQNLVYKKITDGRGNDTYQINCCVGGDSGQSSCKFNIQPQLKNTNHSALALSIIAFWFGKETRKLMEHFLQIPMQQIDYINLNGFNTTINRRNVKIDVKFYFCSDFMTAYNFFGLKGQCSRYFCYLCTLESGSNKNPKKLDDYNYRVAEYRSLKHSANNLDYSEKALPLSTTIRAEDTITPWLHIFLGLFKDEFLALMELVKEEDNGEDIEDNVFQYIKSLNINTKQYFETFSGNATRKLLVNAEGLISLFPTKPKYNSQKKES